MAIQSKQDIFICLVVMFAFALSGMAVSTSVVGSAAEADEETTIAKSLAAMVNAGLAVISKHQDHIDNANIGTRVSMERPCSRKRSRLFQEATGSDPLKIDPNSRHGRLLGIEMNAIVEIMDANQKSINQSGIGFKGFIPSTFGRLIIEEFSKGAEGDAEIKITAPPELVRNRKSRPDAWETSIHSREALVGELAQRANLRRGRRKQGPPGVPHSSTDVLLGVLPALPRQPERRERRYGLSERRCQRGQPRRNHQHYAFPLMRAPVRGEGAMMLQKFSIRSRLLFLSGALILMIAGAIYYLTTKLADNSRAVAHNVELAELIDIAQDVRNIFGQFRYWTTDLAVSQLRQSEVNAKATRERLLPDGWTISQSASLVEAAALKRQVAHFEEAALSAVEQYTDDQRVLGNTLLAEARQHSVRINDRLSAIVDDLNREVLRARDQVVSDVAQTTRIAYILVALTIILGIATDPCDPALDPRSVAPGHCPQWTELRRVT